MEGVRQLLQKDEDKFLIILSLGDGHVDDTLTCDETKRDQRFNVSIRVNVQNHCYERLDFVNLLELMVFNINTTLNFFLKILRFLQQLSCIYLQSFTYFTEN